MLPGSNYGKHGEGYLRIAITRPVEVLSEAMRRLKKEDFDLGRLRIIPPGAKIPKRRIKNLDKENTYA